MLFLSQNEIQSLPFFSKQFSQHIINNLKTEKTNERFK